MTRRPFPHVVCDWCGLDLGPVKGVSEGPGPDGRWALIVRTEQLDHANTCPNRPDAQPEETPAP
jgi:hypothetical protein